MWAQDYNNLVKLNNNNIIIYFQMRQKGLTKSSRSKVIYLSVLNHHYNLQISRYQVKMLK